MVVQDIISQINISYINKKTSYPDNAIIIYQLELKKINLQLVPKLISSYR